MLVKQTFRAAGAIAVLDSLLAPVSTSFFVSATSDEDDDEDAPEPAAEPAAEPSEPEIDPAHPNWMDTPVLTELWKLIAHEDPAVHTDQALFNYMYQNPTAAQGRARDGRGALWWAWEFKNSYALAALKGLGGLDVNAAGEEFQDKGGEEPKAMCKADDGDSCDKLVEGLDAAVENILAAKKEKEEADARQLDLDEEDEDDKAAIDDDDDEAAGAAAAGNGIDVDADDDL